MVNYSYATAGIGHSGDETYVALYVEKTGHASLTPQEARRVGKQLLERADDVERLVRLVNRQMNNHA